MIVPEGTEVATRRSEPRRTRRLPHPEPLLQVPSVRRSAVASSITPGHGDPTLDLTDRLDAGTEIALFAARPEPGNCFYIGLTAPAPRCVVVVRVDGDVEGYGINPDRPPVRWQAWTGSQWQACEIERDGTGGFNRVGDVVLHIPGGHRVSTIANRRAAWLRCLVTPAEPGDEPYGASPARPADRGLRGRRDGRRDPR